MELTEKTYKLICTLRFYEKTVIDEGTKAPYKRKLCLLIPEVNDECMRFFRAWLPDVSEEYHEVVSEMGAPVHSPCRLSVHRFPHIYSPEKNFLFVMTKGVEDILLKQKEGKVIHVKILPETDDVEADFAVDSDQIGGAGVM